MSFQRSKCRVGTVSLALGRRPQTTLAPVEKAPRLTHLGGRRMRNTQKYRLHSDSWNSHAVPLTRLRGQMCLIFVHLFHTC